MSQTPSILHLALPGLLWPAQAMQDMVFDLKLPALSWLLGKGGRSLHPVADSQQWLAEVAGLSELPTAALRASALQQEQTGRWLCLDPIHLRVERTQLIVQDPASLRLTEDEAAALMADLAPLLDELGALHGADPHEWLLHLHEESDIRTTPLADAIELNGDQLMPKAGNVKLWRRLLNEVQVTLHEHPVNLARSARGLPAVNSVWPWGEGDLKVGQADWNLIEADGTLWQGLSRHLGCAWSALPERFENHAGKTLALNPALDIATRQRDAIQWRAALQSLETAWFEPIAEALQSGALRQFVLHGQGEGQALRMTVSGSNRLNFWRKPAPLAALGVGASPSAHAGAKA
ncbi:MAG: hypothetical protein KGL40_00970 [Rhodocyclaceae bacterium]|nr:hypothetical protein [Rhodocyclaceae bacterium]